ncbi:MFS transporter [Phenylobacterium sp. J367]|uniref:MFS transporter n=1 Tax=Phenylobacterium sp. J367 TaxID=2898435 RepID=UPI002150CA16|nr:MFS transporter [Phenylobacterium sp. J367]MCR5879240.1 MFS transporter [Phenylobacterium sp. J367]
MTAPAAAHTRGSTVRLAMTSSVAAGVEWYDFFVYGTAAALVFPHIFFSPDLSPLVAQLAAFSTFAVGFIARPLGGVVFGHFGDLYGRKTTLVAALVIMGVSTLLVGLLPTYATAGMWAPLMLIVLRFAQGFAVGGQWGAAALIAIENAPEGRRGLFGSFVQIGVPSGVILANVAFILSDGLMDRASFEAWGWRIPFLLSIVVVGLALFVHTRIQESREFVAAAAERKAAGPSQAPRRSPILQVIASSWRRILLAGGAFIASNACFYVIITWVISYGTTELALSRELMLGGVMFGSLCMIPALILVASASDRFGRYGLFRLGCITTGLWSFAFFPLLETGSPLGVGAAIAVGLCCVAMMYGPPGGAVRRAVLHRGPIFGGVPGLSGRRPAGRRLRADDRHGPVRGFRQQHDGGRVHGGNLLRLARLRVLAPCPPEG